MNRNDAKTGRLYLHGLTRSVVTYLGGIRLRVVKNSGGNAIVCNFCKQGGTLVTERNIEANRLLVGCLCCGHWWSLPDSTAIQQRRHSIPDRNKASRTDRRHNEQT